MLGGDEPAGAEHKGILNGVDQLAYVARPGIGQQALHGPRGHPAYGLAAFERDALDAVIGDERNVFQTAAQGGDVQGHHVDAVEKVFTELALGDEALPGPGWWR